MTFGPTVRSSPPTAPASSAEKQRHLDRAIHETEDSVRVLEGGGLHPDAVAHLTTVTSLKIVLESGLAVGALTAIVLNAVMAPE